MEAKKILKYFQSIKLVNQILAKSFGIASPRVYALINANPANTLIPSL